MTKLQEIFGMVHITCSYGSFLIWQWHSLLCTTGFIVHQFTAFLVCLLQTANLVLTVFSFLQSLPNWCKMTTTNKASQVIHLVLNTTIFPFRNITQSSIRRHYQPLLNNLHTYIWILVHSHQHILQKSDNFPHVRLQIYCFRNTCIYSEKLNKNIWPAKPHSKHPPTVPGCFAYIEWCSMNREKIGKPDLPTTSNSC